MTRLDAPEDEPQESAFKGWDDAQVVEEHRHGQRTATARVELARRSRFEAAWCGGWTSGPSSPVPPPPPQYMHLIAGSRPHANSRHVSRGETRRQEYRKLCAQSKSSNKAERNAARYLLKTCFSKSVP